MSEADDLGPEYEARRDEAERVDAVARMTSWARRPRQDGAGPPREQSASETERQPITPLSIVQDAGHGVVEAPLASARGVVNAANEMLQMIRDGSDVIRETFPAYAEFEASVGAAPDPGSEAPQLPNFAPPDSATGGMVESVSQFLIGFFGAGKLKLMRALQPTSRVGQTGKAAGQGAIADFAAFDPHEERLSDLIEEYPELSNPVTDFLDADPDDSAAEGRLKNALEGLGLGVVVDGLSLGLRALRTARSAREADPALDEMRPRLAEDAFAVLEQPAPVQRTAVSDSSGRILTPAEEGLSPTFVNFARIDTPGDVKAAIGRMADEHRIEPTTFREIELDADQVNAWEALSARRPGQPLSASESVAARNLWAASGAKLAEVARLASSDPSEANLFMFRRMMAVHRTIQDEVLDARTETARALASWRIPAGGTAEQFRDVSLALESNGGPELAREMAQRLAGLADAGLVHEADRVVERSAYVRTRDAMVEAWVNGLLSGPKTHLVNMMSNTSVIFQQMYERAVAARIANVLGTEDSVQIGEALAQFHGMASGLRDGFRYAIKAFRTGESGFGLNKVELPRERSISSEAFNISSESMTGRTVDMLGALANVPVRALGAEDEFFKTIGYRMELHARALRMASEEVNAGLISPEAIKDRAAEIVLDPPENIRLAAVDAATYQTFTNPPGPLAKKISAATTEYPALKFILPFIRTPANIVRYTFERTPLAPLMKQVREDMAAGGTRRDLALSRMATGTAILFASADLHMGDQITGKGPADPSERQALRRNGWQPYSIKVGDRYYAYNRMDPLGMTLGLGADMAELLANDEYGVEREKTMDQAAIAIALSIANNVTSKTYLSSLSDFFEAMSSPERYGENFFKRFAGSAIPTGVAEITRIQDPYMREAVSMMGAIRRRTPGLSDELPPRRDLWGRKISYQSGHGAIYDAVSPIYSSRENPEPIDEEILRLEASVRMPSKRTSFDGVTVDMDRYPEAWSRYLELAGNELKHPAWNMGAKDLLNAVVNGRHPLSESYRIKSDGPDGTKADFIRQTISDYRSRARRELLAEFDDLAVEVERRQEDRRRLKIGIASGQ